MAFLTFLVLLGMAYMIWRIMDQLPDVVFRGYQFLPVIMVHPSAVGCPRKSPPTMPPMKEPEN